MRDDSQIIARLGRASALLSDTTALLRASQRLALSAGDDVLPAALAHLEDAQEVHRRAIRLFCQVREAALAKAADAEATA